MIRNHLSNVPLVLVAIYALLIVVLWPAVAKSDEETEPSPIQFMALEAPHAPPAQMSTSAHVDRPARMSFRAIVTGYGAEPGQTDDTPFTTASGSHVHAGGIACPVKFPFGTRFRIGGNEYVCDDRMNPRYQHEDRFDIFFPNNADAIHFGTKTMTVEVLQ